MLHKGGGDQGQAMNLLKGTLRISARFRKQKIRGPSVNPLGMGSLIRRCLIKLPDCMSQSQNTGELGIVTHTCYPNTGEAEARGQGQPVLHGCL